MSKGLKNVYTCRVCTGEIVTIDREDGVTPFALACRATDSCRGMMTSAFYKCNQSLVPAFEWYKPSSMKGLDDGAREHVQKGGLLLQRIPANPHNIDDPLLRRAVGFVEGRDMLSAADLMRQFRVDYPKAGYLLNELADRNFIEAEKDKKGRHAIIKRLSKGFEVYVDPGSEEGDCSASFLVQGEQ